MSGRLKSLRRALFLGPLVWAAVTSSAVAFESSADLANAVRRLGADEFSARRDAGNVLLRAGESAVPVLREALMSESPEVRYRAGDLLMRIERQLLELQMEDIAAGRPISGDLPVWERYALMVGTDVPARSLLVQMLERAPELMLSIGSDRLQDQFDQSIGGWMNPTGRRRRPLEISELAVLLFAMIQPECRPSPVTANLVVQHLNSAALRNEVNNSDIGPTVKSLISEWVLQPDAAPALTRMSLAYSYQMDVGRTPALEILRNPVPNTELQSALLYLGVYGKPEDLPHMERLLENKQELTSAQGSANAVTSQVRDVALAMLWKMNGQNPATHGMSTYAEQAGSPKPGSMGFPAEEARTRALAEWRAWRNSHLKADLPPDGQAVEGRST